MKNRHESIVRQFFFSQLTKNNNRNERVVYNGNSIEPHCFYSWLLRGNRSQSCQRPRARTFAFKIREQWVLREIKLLQWD